MPQLLKRENSSAACASVSFLESRCGSCFEGDDEPHQHDHHQLDQLQTVQDLVMPYQKAILQLE